MLEDLLLYRSWSYELKSLEEKQPLEERKEKQLSSLFSEEMERVDALFLRVEVGGLR